jgi:hypothetical protein
MVFYQPIGNSDEHHWKLTTVQELKGGISRLRVPRIPRMEVYDRILSGTKEKGINIKKDMTFHVVVDISGTSALRESANSTTSATLELISED